MLRIRKIKPAWLVEFPIMQGALPYACIVEAETVIEAVTKAAQLFHFGGTDRGVSVSATQCLTNADHE